MPTYTILKKTVVPRALTSRASAGFHVRLVFRLCSTLKRLLILRGTMAWLLKSHNGVHCCGTVGDSHSHSQLSTATCTSQGGLLCFRSALQRYNIIFTPPNKSKKKSAPRLSCLRADSFLCAYARCGAQCRQYRRCNRCDKLNHEFYCFLLSHNG